MADVGIATGFYPQAQPNALFGTAQAALGVRNAQLQNQLLGTANQQTHQDLVKSQVQYLAGGLGILAKKPDLSQTDMLGFAKSALDEGMISPQTYQIETQNVTAAGNDPAKLSALATNYAQRALDAGKQFDSTFGVNTTVDTGPNLVTGVQSPFTGFTPQSSIGKDLTPETANTPYKVPTIDPVTHQPTGGETLSTIGKIAGAVNGNQLTAPPAPPAGGANPLMGPAPSDTGVPAGPVAPTLPGIPSITPQQTQMNLDSGKQYQAAKEAAATYASDVIPLQKMIELLPKTQTGLGAETVTNLAKVASTFGINLPSDSNQAQYYSELEKYANVLARSSGAAPNSDAQLLAAMSSNPNVSMNNAAAQDVAKVMLSLRRMQQATYLEAKDKGIKPEGYSDFAGTLGSQQDPRAYGVDLMTPEAKAALFKELQSDPVAKAKFLYSLKLAEKAKVLGVPSGQ